MTLNEYKVQARNLKKRLEEQGINGLHVMQEPKRVNQDVERLETKKKQLPRMTDKVLHGTV